MELKKIGDTKAEEEADTHHYSPENKVKCYYVLIKLKEMKDRNIQKNDFEQNFS